MTNVYAWPPVGCVGAEWSRISPVNRSRSLITGKDYASAHARERRVATLEVTALSNGAMGAGYMEMLKRYLQGGVHLVRLYSFPINRIMDADDRADYTRSHPLVFIDDGDVVEWSDGANEVKWYTGAKITGTGGSAGGYNVITVSGFPANVLVAMPGEFVTVYGSSTVTTQVITAAYSNADGIAVIRVMDAISGTGVVSLGTRDTAVFKPVNLPRSVQPLSGDWSYSWSFREVFADEVPGGFTEVDPWN